METTRTRSPSASRAATRTARSWRRVRARRSIEVNGQITPLIVVADGEAYQLVAGHRRTAA